MDHLPNTTFIRGKVIPVHIEAVAAAKRSNLSALVEYEKILYPNCQHQCVQF
jgi:hypothetical protein